MTSYENADIYLETLSETEFRRLDQFSNQLISKFYPTDYIVRDPIRCQADCIHLPSQIFSIIVSCTLLICCFMDSKFTIHLSRLFSRLTYRRQVDSTFNQFNQCAVLEFHKISPFNTSTISFDQIRASMLVP